MRADNPAFTAQQLPSLQGSNCARTFLWRGGQSRRATAAAQARTPAAAGSPNFCDGGAAIAHLRANRGTRARISRVGGERIRWGYLGLLIGGAGILYT